MNRPVNDDIDDVLSRLDELYLLRKTRYCGYVIMLNKNSTYTLCFCTVHYEHETHVAPLH